MLNERKKKILQIIIEDYISSAEPVGSRTIARKYDLGLSPATIRNEMSDLELLGYLEQPHTSAGRIPSAQAYRFYVDALIEPGTLTDNDMALIDGWYNERRRNIDDIFQSTAKILSRMTQNVSMVLTNQQTIANFCYLKFLPHGRSTRSSGRTHGWSMPLRRQCPSWSPRHYKSPHCPQQRA